LKLIGTLLEAGNNFNNFTNKSKKPCTNFITLDIVELQKKWPAIVGKGLLLNHTIPYKLLNGELHIVTNYRPLLNESYYMGKILKKKLEKENKNKKFITGTIFVFDDALFTQQKEIIKRLYSKNKSKRYFHPFSPEFKLLRKKANQEFSFIDDQEVKKQLVSLFMQKSCNKD
tara:strand:+ start:417 stop:932 length:516 start_codon:yes stop_codon:yes gene_type:complete